MRAVNSFITLITILTLSFSSFTASAFSLFNEADNSYLWRFKDEQYVRLAPNEGASANQHPAEFTTDRIRAILAPLQVERDKTTIPIFEDRELDILSPAIATGLSRATPAEDVTFAIIGMHRGLISNENRVTTGRIFYQAGALQLVFGDLHAEIDYSQDRRLHPFIAGSRYKNTATTWKIVPQTGLTVQQAQISIAVDAFVQAAQQRALSREMPEKLAGETQKVSAETARLTEEVSQLKAEVQTLRQSPNTTAQSPAMLKATTTPPAETQELKQAVSKLQQEVKTLKQTPPVVSSTSPTATATSVEERLLTLKSLREKNLITEAEYQQKRKQILDSL
ncbi:hypothetical protein BegalDRAFT_3487 [Beggiatoa alba B18LD]|uniref:SHOCT domain-containing protein n=1 Tax=Beggiatoa alba B18LD TaxID=395493 RepID=I3CL04_9GAMM|nr:SHOCT domain-containing protein [Beggiatoa alba]EIJ44297.1 hypothetical protein BegalDRAFT_3487 [Beggiatoa alba B18LD]